MEQTPGRYSNYTTADGQVNVTAQFAAFDVTTDPIKAFVFNAASYTVEGVEVTPIKEQCSEHKHQRQQNAVAEYIGPTTSDKISDTGVIFYHFEEFDGLCKQERIVPGEYETATMNGELPTLPSFTDFFVLSELHELCHWAIPIEDQPDDPRHSFIWNTILSTVFATEETDCNLNPDFSYSFREHESSPVTVPDLNMEPVEHDSLPGPSNT